MVKNNNEEWSVFASGYGKTPVKILEDTTLTKETKLLYITLCTFADKNGKCFPSEKAILKRSGLCRSTFYKYKKELKRRGYIDYYQPRNKAEYFKSCEYTLNGFCKETPLKNKNNDITMYRPTAHGKSVQHYTDSPCNSTPSVQQYTDKKSVISSVLKDTPCTTAQYTNNITDHNITDHNITNKLYSLDYIYIEYRTIYDATLKYAQENNHELTEIEKNTLLKLIGQTKGKYTSEKYYNFLDTFNKGV